MSVNNDLLNNRLLPLPNLSANDFERGAFNVNNNQECCLCNRVCRFALICAGTTAVITALIVGLILGPLGALIGFYNGALTGGLLGIVIAKNTEVVTRVPQESTVPARVDVGSDPFQIDLEEIEGEITAEQWAEARRQMAEDLEEYKTWR